VIKIAASTKLLMNLCTDNVKLNEKMTKLLNDLDKDLTQKLK